MNSELLKKALAEIKSVPVLVNLISRRERELINGSKPLINPAELLTDEDRSKNRSALDVDKCDIALAEVAEGKLIAEIDFDAIAKSDDAKTKWNSKRMSVSSLLAE